CTADKDCQTNFCTDGVCCNERCNGACKKCNQEGACVPTAAGTNDSKCQDDGRESCNQDGTCDGAGRCRLYRANTVCDPQCGRTCDGKGTCRGQPCGGGGNGGGNNGGGNGGGNNGRGNGGGNGGNNGGGGNGRNGGGNGGGGNGRNGGGNGRGNGFGS